MTNKPLVRSAGAAALSPYLNRPLRTTAAAQADSLARGRRALMDAARGFLRAPETGGGGLTLAADHFCRLYGLTPDDHSLLLVCRRAVNAPPAHQARARAALAAALAERP